MESTFWDVADDLMAYTEIQKCGPSGIGRLLGVSYTRRQTVVALSSAEAELYATAAGVSEAILLRKVSTFFGYVVGL